MKVVVETLLARATASVPDSAIAIGRQEGHIIHTSRGMRPRAFIIQQRSSLGVSHCCSACKPCLHTASYLVRPMSSCFRAASM